MGLILRADMERKGRVPPHLQDRRRSSRSSSQRLHLRGLRVASIFGPCRFAEHPPEQRFRDLSAQEISSFQALGMLGTVQADPNLLLWILSLARAVRTNAAFLLSCHVSIFMASQRNWANTFNLRQVRQAGEIIRHCNARFRRDTTRFVGAGDSAVGRGLLSFAKLHGEVALGLHRPRHAESQWPTASCEVQALRKQWQAASGCGDYGPWPMAALLGERPALAAFEECASQ